MSRNRGHFKTRGGVTVGGERRANRLYSRKRWNYDHFNTKTIGKVARWRKILQEKFKSEIQYDKDIDKHVRESFITSGNRGGFEIIYSFLKEYVFHTTYI